MAEVWQAGSTAKLLHVPWDSSYSKVVQFDSPAARDAWFDAQDEIGDLSIAKQTYIRPSVPLTVDAPYSEVYGANYLTVTNPAQPVDGARAERLFYFITATEYMSPASTRLTLQLDVWQTRFMEGAKLGCAFLERGHLPVKESYYAVQAGASVPEVLREWCAADEGLDVGADYQVTPLGVIGIGAEPPYVAILSTADLTEDPGDVENPNLSTGQSIFNDNVLSAANVYYLSSADFRNYMYAMRDRPWVTQCILSVTAIPAELVEELSAPVTLGGTAITAYQGAESVNDPITGLNVNIHDLEGIYDEHYIKLLAYPYSLFELTGWTGSPLLMKPQVLRGTYTQLYVVSCIMPPFTRCAIVPRYYAARESGEVEYSYGVAGASGAVNGGEVLNGDFLDSALWLQEFPTFSVVNNQATLSLASRANTLRYQYQAAGWSLARSNAATQNAYEQAQRGLATSEANQGLQNQLINFQQGANLVSGGIGVLGNLASLNFGGAASGAASTAIGYMTSQQAQDVSNAQFRNNQNLTGANADANMRLASYINQSNYQQAIAGINATVQDAQLTPPGVSGQTGGDGFAMARGLFRPVLRKKQLPHGAATIITQYFKRYGYTFRQWVEMPRDLRIMSNFTYWKTLDLTLDCASANETESDAIRGIFNQGVTVYATPEAIMSCGVDTNIPKED